MTPAHAVVKVVFLCAEVQEHTLGAVARQVMAVSGSPAGTESITGDFLTAERSADGQNLKLVGECGTCRKQGSLRRAELRWDGVGKLLDVAEYYPEGVLVVPLAI